MENNLAQLAALKQFAVLRYGKFGKDTKIGHFLRFFIGGTKEKWPKK